MDLQHPTPSDLLTADDIAVLLNVSRRTLSRWSRLRKGPPRVKVGRSVFYRRHSVEEWFLSLEQETAATGLHTKNAVTPRSRVERTGHT